MTRLSILAAILFLTTSCFSPPSGKDGKITGSSTCVAFLAEHTAAPVKVMSRALYWSCEVSRQGVPTCIKLGGCAQGH